MSEHDTSPRAFPISPYTYYQPDQPGMTLRDYFAGQALVGLLAHGGNHFLAYEIADQMLKLREAMV